MTHEITSDRRIYTSADGERLHEHYDEEAAFLLAPEGGIIPIPAVDKFGLRLEDGAVVWDGMQTSAKEGGIKPGPFETPGQQGKPARTAPAAAASDSRARPSSASDKKAI